MDTHILVSFSFETDMHNIFHINLAVFRTGTSDFPLNLKIILIENFSIILKLCSFKNITEEFNPNISSSYRLKCIKHGIDNGGWIVLGDPFLINRMFDGVQCRLITWNTQY